MVMADTDNDAGAGDDAAWQAWFVPEREAREAALAALPGKENYERFEALNRASQIFGKNGLELRDHLAVFLGTDQHVHQLDEGFSQETVRLLHNYLASVGSLRDMQRSIHHRLWPQRAEPDNPENTKTAWEVNVYNPRTEIMFGDDAIQFLFDLRNFTLHYSVPLVEPATRMTWAHDAPFAQINSIPLRRSELLKYTRWNAASKRLIESINGDIDFVPILERYAILARMFYGWFWRKVRAEVGIMVDEYVHKSNEYGLWLAELHAMPDWTDGEGPDNPPMPIPGTMFVNRCRRTLARAQHGTAGWRTITVNSAGVAVVGESNWTPLPKFRR
jgi:hypothetical protein